MSRFLFVDKLQKQEHVELVCTGTMEEPRKEGYIRELKDLISELGIQDKVRLLGLIPKLEQIEIMKDCIAVIQPTLFEGGPGGGSIWDAIALGIPSVVSDLPVNCEITDETVEFFKTGDVNNLLDKMKNAIIKSEMAYSKEILIKKSEENMKNLGNYLMEVILKEVSA